MKKKVGIVSLGCPKNLVDSEVMLGMFNDGEYEITADSSQAEVIIVNTCGFIESAKQESIETILQMAKMKEKMCRALIVTGCLAQRYKEDILKEIPEVDAVVGTASYADIDTVVDNVLRGSHPAFYRGEGGLDYLESQRVVSTGKAYAYIKIAEGCDNCCTYCVIPSLRGRYTSRSMESILGEARRLAEQGLKELVLVAQDTTRYGVDLYGKKKLVELIRNISQIEGVEWIRLLYCYPEEIDTQLIMEMSSNPKVCRYLDIPLQHYSDKILRLMGRRGGSSEISDLFALLREHMPDIVVRTSLIVGFPGETQEDYEILLDFVNKFRIDRVGIFIYSKEDGTPASKMKPMLPKTVKNSRRDTLMLVQQKISKEKNLDRLGKIYKALIEGIDEDGVFYFGRTYAEAPEIDGMVYFTSKEPLIVGSFVNVKILDASEYDLTGEVVDESSQ